MGKDAAMPNTWTELESEIRLALQPLFELRSDDLLAGGAEPLIKFSSYKTRLY